MKACGRYYQPCQICPVYIQLRSSWISNKSPTYLIILDQINLHSLAESRHCYSSPSCYVNVLVNVPGQRSRSSTISSICMRMCRTSLSMKFQTYQLTLDCTDTGRRTSQDSFSQTSLPAKLWWPHAGHSQSPFLKLAGRGENPDGTRGDEGPRECPKTGLAAGEETRMPRPRPLGDIYDSRRLRTTWKIGLVNFSIMTVSGMLPLPASSLDHTKTIQNCLRISEQAFHCAQTSPL